MTTKRQRQAAATAAPPPPPVIDRVVLMLPAVDVALAASSDGSTADTATWAIGRPGIWNALFGTVEVTAEKLRIMADSYDPTGNDRAALNFDHAFGGPAQGWVDELFLQGEMLMARLSNLSDDVVQAIKARRYTRVSMEITHENPLTHDWYLCGLALLGAQPPAIKGLPEVTLAAAGHLSIFLTEGEAAAAAPDPDSETTGALAPPTDASAEEAEGDPMKQTATTIAGGGGGTPASPASPAETQTPATPATPEQPAVATTEGTTTELATRADNALAAANSALDRARAIEQRARMREAVAEVEADLRPLRDVLPPSMLSTDLQEVLVQLRAAEQPLTVKLAAAKAGEQPREVTVYQVLLTHLKAAPKSTLLGSRSMASGDDVDQPLVDSRSAEERETHRRMGLSDEQAMNLMARRARAI